MTFEVHEIVFNGLLKKLQINFLNNYLIVNE
jgi:hypothetical protein